MCVLITRNVSGTVLIALSSSSASRVELVPVSQIYGVRLAFERSGYLLLLTVYCQVPLVILYCQAAHLKGFYLLLYSVILLLTKKTFNYFLICSFHLQILMYMMTLRGKSLYSGVWICFKSCC